MYISFQSWLSLTVFIVLEHALILHCMVHIYIQGMVALGALSYMLRLDGQNSTADRYDKANKGFIQYWLQNATVSINHDCVYIYL